MRASLLVFSLVLVALAGCLDRSAEPDAGPGAATSDAPRAKPGLVYEVDPDSANETELEGAHTHDEWGQTTELTLLDETVATAECADPFTTAALAFFGLVSEQQVQVGCASWRLGDGHIVPEGTEWLRIEVDASDALQQGGMQLSYANEDVRRTWLDEATSPTHVWRVPVAPIEWDLPHSTETSWSFVLQPSGQVSVLDGTVDVFVVAERMADWRPILGSAHIDHWAPDADHAFVAPGVFRALDTNTTVVMSSFADRVAAEGGASFSSVALDDIVAPGAAQVTVVVAWDKVAGCPAGHACWLVSFLNPGNGQRIAFEDPVERGDGWAVYVYDSPVPLAPDSTYAEQSVYAVTSFVRACPDADLPDASPMPFLNGCLGEAVSTMEAETRFVVEVWQGPADLQAAKARAGIP